MFKKAHAEEFIEKLGNIKTYKLYKSNLHFKSRKIKNLEQIMTLHHLQHKADNGETSITNGAIINELAHRYIHSLPRNQEEIINDYIREWKKRNFKHCEIEITEDFPESDFEINISEIQVEDKIKVFSRAKIKRETRKEYEEYLNEREENL